MIRSVLALLSALAVASLAAAQPRSTVQSPTTPLELGIAHFQKAYSELTPGNKVAEAAAEFDRAVAAFERALAASPRSVEAHTYLARIHTIRKNHRLAARHYDAAVAVEPMNVDLIVRAAGAHFRAGDLDAARARLVDARLKTNDAGALARLDEFIAKVDAAKR